MDWRKNNVIYMKYMTLIEWVLHMEIYFMHQD